MDAFKKIIIQNFKKKKLKNIHVSQNSEMCKVILRVDKKIYV